MLPTILDFSQTKEYLRIGKSTLLELLRSKELKGFKLKGSWRVHENDLVEYLETLRREEI